MKHILQILLLAIPLSTLGAAPLVSSPETERSYANTPPFDDWAETFSPTPGKPWQGGMIKPSDLEIESEVDHLNVTALSKLFIDNQRYATLDDPWKPRPPVMVHASRETQRVTLPDGKSLAIDAIFTTYPTGPARSDWMSGLFDPMTLVPFQPVPGKEIPMIKPSRENHFFPQKEFPEMAFIVSGDLTHTLDFRLFDTKTHQPMKEVMAMGGNIFELPLRQWHSSAFRCVIDVASGPIEEGEIGFRTGSTASFSDFDLEVIAIEKLNHPVIGHEWLVINRPQLFPSFSDSAKASQPPSPPKRRYNWTLDPTKTAGGTLVAFSLSNVQWLPPSIEIEAFSDSGTLTKVTASCDGNLVFVLLPTPPEQLRSLQIRYPSTWVRAIFEFGRIPGLPKENYGLVNLFNVHIPYSKSNYRPETFISSCTKLRIGDLHSTSSGPISFEYEDTTVQEITEKFRTDAGIFGLRVVDGQRLEGRRSP